MRLIRCPFFYVLIFAALPAIGQGQLDRFVYRQPDTAWRPELLAYVRNTEFFHPAEEGRTRFGALAGMRRRFDVAPAGAPSWADSYIRNLERCPASFHGFASNTGTAR